MAVATLVAVAGLGSVLSVMVAGKFGNEALGMKTGSMAPGIKPGDLAIVRAVAPASIRNGDMITFRRPDAPSEVYTHRVVSISYTGSAVSFHTKGDANPVADPWKVSYTGPAWRVTHVVRYGGYAMAIAQSRVARELVALSIFALALCLLWPVLVVSGSSPDRALELSTAGVR